MSLDSLSDDVLFTVLKYSYPDGFLVCKKFTKLLRKCRVILDLNKASKLGLPSTCIENAIFGSTRINCLIIPGWFELSNLHISKLIHNGHFRFIKFISFRNCNKISSNSILNLLEKISFNVIGIDLFDCSRLDSYAIFSILSFPNLKILSLGGFSKSLYNNDLLNKLFPNLNDKYNDVKLKRLDLIGCKFITDISPLNRPYLINLEYLDLTGLNNIDSLNCLSNLINLKHLIIPGLNLDSSILFNIIKNMNVLESLDISGSNIDNSIINYIVNNSYLSSLKFSKCSGFDNICLRKIITNLPNLSMIDVSQCWKLTESFIANSLVKSGNNLTQFGIYQCSLDVSNVKMLLAKAGAENELSIAKPIDFKNECKNNTSINMKRKRYDYL